MSMNDKYTAYGLFRDGTDRAEFSASREGLNAAYRFVADAAAWEIKRGKELVDEVNPWVASDEVEPQDFLAWCAKAIAPRP